jgi:hypothetical protein
VVNITGGDAVIKQEIRPDSIQGGYIINRDNYLLNVNRQCIEVFEITDTENPDAYMVSSNLPSGRSVELFKQIIQNMNDYQKLIPERSMRGDDFFETEEMVKLDKILYSLIEKIGNEKKPVNLKDISLIEIKNKDGKNEKKSIGELFYQGIMEMNHSDSRMFSYAVLLELLLVIELDYVDYNYSFYWLTILTKNFFTSLWSGYRLWVKYDYDGYKLRMLSRLRTPETSLFSTGDIDDLQRHFLSLLTVLDDTFWYDSHIEVYDKSGRTIFYFDILNKTIDFLYLLPKTNCQIDFDRTYFYSMGIRIAILTNDEKLEQFCLDHLPEKITEGHHALSLALDASSKKDRDRALKYMDLAFTLSGGRKYWAGYESVLFRDIIRDRDFYKYIYW